ncbi:hypothetical protein BCR37DRAFT_376594 [Protomyces lactucae-debilis]|uniref:Uncharacterized protein n=1 Tax=Protomyces lactucae-debilis TaxID=2754530 RepID=A0A1Y2FQ03_PROLT|nr:uncharacterized protein BCR37DRAFT_376594 [Protomyces lactucae-debilis]ORY86073.1 hypothetical protein BCR37DRAFT_376594 [Protomyces lactucae-debilis]
MDQLRPSGKQYLGFHAHSRSPLHPPCARFDHGARRHDLLVSLVSGSATTRNPANHNLPSSDLTEAVLDLDKSVQNMTAIIARRA